MRKSKGKRFQCDECDNDYATTAGLSRHKTNDHMKKSSLQCAVCSKSFGNRKDNLQRHQEKCSVKALKPKEKKEWKCDQCIDVFSTKYSLNRHIKEFCNPEKKMKRKKKGRFISSMVIKEENRTHYNLTINEMKIACEDDAVKEIKVREDVQDRTDDLDVDFNVQTPPAPAIDIFKKVTSCEQTECKSIDEHSKRYDVETITNTSKPARRTSISP